jgi:hypothetical protein
VSRTRKASRRGVPAPAGVIPAATLIALEAIEKRLRRARHLINCVEIAATAEAEVELGPVTFIAVDLLDRVLDDLAAIMPSQDGAE